MAGQPRTRARKAERFSEMTGKNKYKNKRVIIDGIEFDSKKEGERFIFLRDALNDGTITDLVVHPKYELIPKVTHIEYIQLKTKVKEKEVTDQLPTNYTADFKYMKNGELVVEDVKISKAILPKEFTIKKKLMFWRHGIDVKLIFSANDPL